MRLSRGQAAFNPAINQEEGIAGVGAASGVSSQKTLEDRASPPRAAANGRPATAPKRISAADPIRGKSAAGTARAMASGGIPWKRKATLEVTSPLEQNRP